MSNPTTKQRKETFKKLFLINANKQIFCTEKGHYKLDIKTGELIKIAEIKKL